MVPTCAKPICAKRIFAAPAFGRAVWIVRILGLPGLAVPSLTARRCERPIFGVPTFASRDLTAPIYRRRICGMPKAWSALNSPPPDV